MQEQSSSEELFRGKLINLRVLSIPQPDGGTKRFEIVEHPSWLNILKTNSGFILSGNPELKDSVSNVIVFSYNDRFTGPSPFSASVSL